MREEAYGLQHPVAARGQFCIDSYMFHCNRHCIQFSARGTEKMSAKKITGNI